MKGNILLLFLVLWPMAGAFAAYLLGRRNKRARDYCSDIVSGVALLALLALFAAYSGHGEWAFQWEGVCGLGIRFQLDGFRIVFGVVAGLVWLMTSLFSREYLQKERNRNRYYFFYLLTFSATLGVFFAADLFTAFIFFEIMSMASYVTVIHDEKPASMRAGETYLAVAVIGGMVMLMGIFLLHHHTGTLMISELSGAFRQAASKTHLYVAGALILVGFGAKAGMFPLHIWLPKTYPAAPAPAAAVLSGVLSKAGVFGILAVGSNLFLHDKNWGYAVLILAVVTMVLAGVMGVLSADLRRTLACSSMSQIGFILVGCAMQNILGEYNALAVRGTMLHMVNHSVIKLVLFLAAGVVFYTLKTTNLNDVRGFGRGKPLLGAGFLMGYLGIIGMPLWNGYVSKTLIHESIVEYIQTFAGYLPEARIFQLVEGVFIFAGGLTAAYMTKLLVALFVEKNPLNQEGLDAYNKKYMRPGTAAALLVPAALLPVMGFFPGVVMDTLADMGQGFMNGHAPEHAVHYFSWANLKGALLSLLIGAVLYLLARVCLRRKNEMGHWMYVDYWPAWLDLERIVYRPLIGAAIWLGAFACRLLDAIPGAAVRAAAFVLRPVSDHVYFYPRQPREKRQPAVLLTRSLSFSLMLFGLGTCAVLIYLLVATWAR